MRRRRRSASNAGRERARVPAGVWLPALVAAGGLSAGLVHPTGGAVPPADPYIGAVHGEAEAARGVAAYPDAPPPAHTGGFGEPTCHACHFDGPINHASGELRIDGVPKRYEDGGEYELEIRLRHPELLRSGFQLSARYAKGAARGRQAGSWSLSEPDRTVAVESRDVVYVSQSEPGTWPDGPGLASWSVIWSAPADAEDPVVFHLSANSSNADGSEFGDLIYVRQYRSPPLRSTE